MLRNIKANLLESIIAITILAISCWQAYEAFAFLYPQIGTARSSQFSPLKLEKSYIFHSNSAECLGYLEGKFDRTLENTTYSLKGELYLSVGDIMLPTKLDLETSFNILGQMAASVMKVANMSSNLTLGFLNVDPIEITFLSTAQNAKPERKKFNFPGPLILKDLGDEFQLEYPAANKTIPLSFDGYQLEQLLNIKIRTDSDVKSKCASGKRGSIDIVQLTTQLKNKVSAIFPLIPPGILQQFSENFPSR